MDFANAASEIGRIADKISALDFVAVFEPYPAWFGGVVLGLTAGAIILPLWQIAKKAQRNKRLKEKATQQPFAGIETLTLSSKKPAP